MRTPLRYSCGAADGAPTFKGARTAAWHRRPAARSGRMVELSGQRCAAPRPATRQSERPTGGGYALAAHIDKHGGLPESYRDDGFGRSPDEAGNRSWPVPMYHTIVSTGLRAIPIRGCCSSVVITSA